MLQNRQRNSESFIRMAALAFLFSLFASENAAAVPAYADQTGQPCNACHIGGFSPRLTQSVPASPSLGANSSLRDTPCGRAALRHRSRRPR